MEFFNENCSFVCENCRSERVSIDPNTGEYYCEDCGIQQQEIRELDRDLDDVYFEISSGPEGRKSNIRRASQSTEKSKTQAEIETKDFQNYEYVFFNDLNSQNSTNHHTFFDKWYNKKPSVVKNSDFFIGIQLVIQQIIKDMVERRQLKIDILHCSRKIWFSFLRYMYKNSIPLRTFFADLRCSILKVPFDETTSNITEVNHVNCHSTDENISASNIKKKIFNDIFHFMGDDRIKYLVNLNSKIIKHSNSANIRKKHKDLNRLQRNDQSSIIEEWEISGRKLNILANNRKIPYTTWEGNSTSRSDIIKCVIDMIYEHDFLMFYFQNISNGTECDEFLHKSIEDEFNKWINIHIIFFERDGKINTNDNFMISTYFQYFEDVELKMNMEYLLKKIHTVHILLGLILKEDFLIFSDKSLSRYVPIYQFKNRFSFIKINSRKRTVIEKNDNRKESFEFPKLDYNLILCIIWISLLKCGYPVSSYDIIEWVRSGKIDIFKSESVIPRWLKEAGFKWDNDTNSNKNTRSVTQLSRIPSTNDLEKTMQFFKSHLNISVPPINIPLLIHKILTKCKCLSYKGSISIQPLCIRLWELICKENYLLNFNSYVISSSIIIVIARSIWPIFVYHPAAVPKKSKNIKNCFFNLKQRQFLPETLNIKTLPFDFELFYNEGLFSWVANVLDNENKINKTSTFHSKICGVEWSGMLAMKWIFSQMKPLEDRYKPEIRKILEYFLPSKRDQSVDKIGRPSASFRGNFFTPIRKKRQTQKVKLGNENWSGLMPLYSTLAEFDPISTERIISLSYHLPSNREVYNSLISKIENKLDVLSKNELLQMWDVCDEHSRNQLYDGWERIFSTNRENDVAEVLKSILEGTSPCPDKSLFYHLKKNEFKKDEVEIINKDKIGLLLDELFTIKLNYLNKLFQDPGFFTSVILPLPQFFHSRQKFTNIEASLPLAYIILLKHLSRIVGASCSNIHLCVIKIEELLTRTLSKVTNENK